jgi:hypothetical protein
MIASHAIDDRMSAHMLLVWPGFSLALPFAAICELAKWLLARPSDLIVVNVQPKS